MLKKCVMLAALAVMLAPAPARADWLFTPNIGIAFAGDASGREHLTYGASIGWMGAGIFGWEVDFAYTPEFFEDEDTDLDFIDSSNAMSIMGNVLIGVPIGGQQGPGFRPYFTVGAGMLSRNVQGEDDLFDVDNNEFGFNVGAGALVFATDNVGFRGDIRYYRSLEDPDEDNEFDIGIGNFDFWRATGGVTFRW